MKSLYTIILSFLLFTSASAQYTKFGNAGTVTYAKTMYAKNIVRKQFIEKADERSKPQFEAMLPRIPENLVLQKTLKFKGEETLFEPVKNDLDMQMKQIIMMLGLDFEGTTLSNLKTKEYKRYNDIFGQRVIIQDSVKNVKWKITDEYREIAGYNCRRANGITSDSIYVVGFFSNELLTDGGPESISGLPGLILGLVVPSQHVSFFATKVELNDDVVLDKKLFVNSKAKVMTRAEMVKQFSSSLSNFLNRETLDYVMQLTLL